LISLNLSSPYQWAARSCLALFSSLRRIDTKLFHVSIFFYRIPWPCFNLRVFLCYKVYFLSYKFLLFAYSSERTYWDFSIIPRMCPNERPSQVYCRGHPVRGTPRYIASEHVEFDIPWWIDLIRNMEKLDWIQIRWN
jgi:hypothetical protein